MVYSSSTCRLVWIALLSMFLAIATLPTIAQTEQESYPNLLVDASARLVAAGLAQSLDYTQPLNDTILGARVTGQGHSMGRMEAELVADPDHATIRWVVRGRTDMDTVARQRRVTVWGRGVTTFTANKMLTFDETGFVAGPASSSARSNNWPRCISAPPLIRRMAWQRVQRQRCEGNWIVARHAEPLINAQLNQDAGAIVDSANSAYLEEFREPLMQVGAFPRRVDFSTSNNQLRVVILQAAEGQTGAPRTAPSFNLAHDIGIRMHETAFNNLAESLLAGQTLTDEEVRANVAKFLTMASLEEYAVDNDEQTWSIGFARTKPMTVRFRDGMYTLIIAGERWASGRRRLGPMDVTVTYRIESADGQVQLVRDDEVLIAPPGFVRGKGRLSPRVISARRVLQRKIDQLFPAVINPEGFVVPGPWEKVGAVHVVSMAAEDGWLQVSWEMQSAPGRATPVKGDLVSSLEN